MKIDFTVSALALLIAGCSPAPSGDQALAAASISQTSALAVQQRAADALGLASADRISATLPPFRVAADSLGGKDPLPWGTAVDRSLVTAAFPAETPPRATMQFAKSNGSIRLEISQATGWQFYFECDARPVGNVPQLAFHWVFDMLPGGQVRGPATYHPATKRWAFVTPVATPAEGKPVHVIFWAIESGAPADSHWILHDCNVLPFKLTAQE